MSQTPILQSIASYCSATDVSVLEEVGVIKLMKGERERYLNPVRDLSACNWILEEISHKSKVLLVGPDLVHLIERIKNPTRYHACGLWNKVLVVWLVVIPPLAIAKPASTIYINEFTGIIHRVSTTYYSHIQKSIGVALRAAHIYGMDQHNIGRMRKRHSTSTTLFSRSPEILQEYGNEKTGWVASSVDPHTRLRCIEYHGMRGIRQETGIASRITFYKECGAKIIASNACLGYCRDRNCISTHYIRLHNYPSVLGVSHGRSDITEAKKKTLSIDVNIFSDQGECTAPRRIRIPLK
jgi:hypothetical protein